MMLAERINKVFMDCLYQEGETPNDGSAPKDAVLVEGLVNKFGFHPKRLESHRADVVGFLLEMPDEFHAGKGGGWSFLNLCMTKSGEQWGEHRNMEQLVTLAIGLKMAKFPLPRPLWSSLPGGMPYVVFDIENK